MSQISWSEWHRLYADPNSRLSLRLRAVQTRIQEALDDCPAGDIRVVSLCAGQGQDLLGVLQHHVRRDDVLARLVELDEHNVAIARTTAQATALPRVEIVAGDASQIDLYVGTLPADLVLVCGVFGNISDADIARTIAYMPQLCAPGATVVWTRHLAPPDLTPAIRQWFIDAEFKELGFETVANTFGVGASRFAGGPAELEPGVRLFNFIGYDRLRPLTAMSNTLYALCGLPFAGKSSVARKLATRTGAVLVSLDAINGEYDVGLDGAAISVDQWQRTYAEAYRRIAEQLVHGQSVIFDHGNFSRAERDQVRAIAAQAGARVQFVYVPVAPAEARRRLLANRQTRERDVRDDNFELALQMFEPPDAEVDVVRVASSVPPDGLA
jgi:predicted kinase